jgi:hypothetical protein
MVVRRRAPGRSSINVEEVGTGEDLDQQWGGARLATRRRAAGGGGGYQLTGPHGKWLDPCRRQGATGVGAQIWMWRRWPGCKSGASFRIGVGELLELV